MINTLKIEYMKCIKSQFQLQPFVHSLVTLWQTPESIDLAVALMVIIKAIRIHPLGTSQPHAGAGWSQGITKVSKIHPPRSTTHGNLFSGF